MFAVYLICHVGPNSCRAIVNNRLSARAVAKNDAEKTRHLRINREMTNTRNGKNA
jgi:hypothetical protein